MRTNISLNQIIELNSGYELFWKEVKDQFPVVGERTLEYLRWKYFKNPISRFNMFTHNKTNSSISGYIIFTVQNRNVHIFDILVENSEIFKLILGKFIKDLKKNNYDSVSTGIFQNSPLYLYLKCFRFFDTHEDVPLLYAGDSVLIPKEWFFFSGDRNI